MYRYSKQRSSFDTWGPITPESWTCEDSLPSPKTSLTRTGTGSIISCALCLCPAVTRSRSPICASTRPLQASALSFQVHLQPSRVDEPTLRTLQTRSRRFQGLDWARPGPSSKFLSELSSKTFKSSTARGTLTESGTTRPSRYPIHPSVSAHLNSRQSNQNVELSSAAAYDKGQCQAVLAIQVFKREILSGFKADSSFGVSFALTFTS